MASLNKIFLIGNITRDVESITTPSGVMVGNFSIATNHTTYNKTTKEKKDTTEYHKIVCFGKTAEVVSRYFKKGDPIYIEGRVTYRQWEKDGVKQYRTEIVLTEFQFLKKRDSVSGYDIETEPSEPEIQYPETAEQFDGEPEVDLDIDPDEIPF